MLIATVFGRIHKEIMPLVVAVFLAGGLLLGSAWDFRDVGTGVRGVLGGPSDEGVVAYVPVAEAALSRENGALETPIEPQNISQDTAVLLDPGRPMGILAGRGKAVSYVIKKGDTLSGIALQFGVSVQTITAVNPRVRGGSLQVGQELTILPTSGIVYEVKGGEDLSSIAGFFDVQPERIREFNKDTDFSSLGAGETIVIPGENLRSSALAGNNLPSFPGYFALPTAGYNWGKRHEQNAVDIANVCGTPVVASAEGLVVESVSEGWNSGYGHMLLIEHPNETKTRYAHLEDVLVSIGDYVRQGDQIATIGSTGNVHGPTGCHLHFEVQGAQNPFAR